MRRTEDGTPTRTFGFRSFVRLAGVRYEAVNDEMVWPDCFVWIGATAQ